MQKYVVRQPIKDLNQQIFGYEVVFQDDTGGLSNQTKDRNAADLIADFLLQNGNKIFEDKIAFITFTPNLLFRNVPKIFRQNQLVIQIDDNVIIHPLAQNIIHRYKKQNYKVAVNDFQFAPRYFSMMDIIDYIRLDFRNLDTNLTSFRNIIRTAKGFQKKCIAYGVNTKKAYELAVELEVDYMQGSYIAEDVSKKVNRLEYLQGNFFQLVVELTKDEPDLALVEQIISRDVSLTFSLLKMVNSAYFALRHKVSSIMQSLVILGLGQLKQWIYLLSFQQDDDNLPEDLVKVSLLRANFCSSLLPHATDMPISRSEAYLMGMFSTLGLLMDAPLEELLDELYIADEVKAALLSREGRCGQLYELVLSYEKADWKRISELADALGIPKNVMSQIYFECVETVNNIWNSLMLSSSTSETPPAQPADSILSKNVCLSEEGIIEQKEVIPVQEDASFPPQPNKNREKAKTTIENEKAGPSITAALNTGAAPFGAGTTVAYEASKIVKNPSSAASPKADAKKADSAMDGKVTSSASDGFMPDSFWDEF